MAILKIVLVLALSELFRSINEQDILILLTALFKD